MLPQLEDLSLHLAVLFALVALELGLLDQLHLQRHSLGFLVQQLDQAVERDRWPACLMVHASVPPLHIIVGEDGLVEDGPVSWL